MAFFVEVDIVFVFVGARVTLGSAVAVLDGILIN
jgi:hypothetical protein